MTIGKRATAEFFGTFWLVFGGCGSAVLAAAFPTGEPGAGHLGIGFLGVAFAFGLTLLTMAYTIGPISGCHINPAVSVGLWVGKRFPASDLLPYIIAQVAGAIAAAGVLYVIASGKAGFSTAAGFASNGYGDTPPGAIHCWHVSWPKWCSRCSSCLSSSAQPMNVRQRALLPFQSDWD